MLNGHSESLLKIQTSRFYLKVVLSPQVWEGPLESALLASIPVGLTQVDPNFEKRKLRFAYQT